ncbi:hypothetical protein [Haloferax elongans]|uniref:hypothetical protein n=1 Tax=Haloferax elongans TaxID=403191 RepID=UPI001267762A|nr:hypothetical protein [Haloferax elongans]
MSCAITVRLEGGSDNRFGSIRLRVVANGARSKPTAGHTAFGRVLPTAVIISGGQANTTAPV